MIDLSKLYKEIIAKDKNLQKAISIAQANSKGGDIWLIGGCVYRKLAKELYGTKESSILKNNFDFDIIIENLNDQIKANGWKIGKTGMGQLRLTKKNNQIDLISLSEVDYITKKSLNPSIENFFDGNITNIQAIAYSLKNNQLMGPGIDALIKRKVKIHNQVSLDSYCLLKNISQQEYLEKLSKSLDMELVN